MFVVPGAAGSNWPPPQGADAVWSKSAGRLLMGDLGSEGNTGLRLTSHSRLPLSSPPLLRGSSHPRLNPTLFWCPLPRPSSQRVPPAPLPAPPSHGRQTLLRGGPPTPEAAVLQVWLLEGEGRQGSAGEGCRSAARSPPGSGHGIWNLTADPFPQDLPTPVLAPKPLGALAWKLGPWEVKPRIWSLPFSERKDPLCLAISTPPNFLPGSLML